MAVDRHGHGAALMIRAAALDNNPHLALLAQLPRNQGFLLRYLHIQQVGFFFREFFRFLFLRALFRELFLKLGIPRLELLKLFLGVSLLLFVVAHYGFSYSLETATSARAIQKS